MTSSTHDARPGRFAERVFFVGFWSFVALVGASLVLGLLGNLTGLFPSLHDALHGLSTSGGAVGRTAEAIVEAGHQTHHGGAVAVDYLFSLVYLASGLLLVRARSDNLTARLLGVGLVGTAAAFNLGSHAYLILSDSVVVAAIHLSIHGIAGVAFLHALVRFPDGRLPTVWSRIFVVGSYVVGAVLTVLMVLPVAASAGTSDVDATRFLQNIVAMDATFFVVFFGLLVPLVGALAQRHRIRHAEDPEIRQQSRLLRWGLGGAFTGGAIFVGVLVAIHGPAGVLGELHVYEGWVFRVFPALFAVIPASLIVGVLKYRLWDIDLVVSKTVVFGGLAGFVTVVYVGLVAGVGALVGRGDEPNMLLSIVATAVVAVAFAPVRQALQRFANRLVYGVRATPYEVLSTLSERMRDSLVVDDILQRMAALIADGTGAARTQVWLRVGDELRLAANWPDGTDRQERLALTGDVAADVPGFDLTVPVTHDGAVLGLLSVEKERGESVSPMDEKVVTDLASQAGLVLRNLRLNQELLERLEELRASRQRLVSAQDDERRRIERDLHDGAQQQIVAMKLKVGMARTIAERIGADELRPLLDQLWEESDETVEMLRNLAHGIYPPLLESEGLATALAAQARKTGLPVSLETTGLGRYDREVEAAVYFCVSEALQNVAKYADPTEVTVRLAQTDGHLTFDVVDDGDGFDPDSTARGHGTTNMADRLDALGGELEIRSRIGAGTTVSGRAPVASPAVPAV